MQRTLRTTALVLAAGLICVSACGSDSSTTPGVNVVGTFQLKTINGGPLPALLVQNAAGRSVVTDDEFTLNADHTYSEVGHLQITLTTGSVITQPEADAGVYSNTNGAVVLSSLDGNGTNNATVNGNTLTILLDGATLVYQR